MADADDIAAAAHHVSVSLVEGRIIGLVSLDRGLMWSRKLGFCGILLEGWGLGRGVPVSGARFGHCQWVARHVEIQPIIKRSPGAVGVSPSGLGVSCLTDPSVKPGSWWTYQTVRVKSPAARGPARSLVSCGAQAPSAARPWVIFRFAQMARYQRDHECAGAPR